MHRTAPSHTTPFICLRFTLCRHYGLLFCSGSQLRRAALAVNSHGQVNSAGHLRQRRSCACPAARGDRRSGPPELTTRPPACLVFGPFLAVSPPTPRRLRRTSIGFPLTAPGRQAQLSPNPVLGRRQTILVFWATLSSERPSRDSSIIPRLSHNNESPHPPLVDPQSWPPEFVARVHRRS